ncbi:hypothetical protein TWF281_010361 [Arthrobotrys megalospora]
MGNGVPAEQGPTTDMVQGSAPRGELHRDDSSMDTPQSRELTGAEEDEVSDDGVWYDEWTGRYMYRGETISYINGDLITPQEWIQDPYFEGYWRDKTTNKVHLYCQSPLALSIRSDGQAKWLTDNYFWARHPLTVPMSKYECLTSEFNSIAPASVRRGGPLAANTTQKAQRACEVVRPRALCIPGAKTHNILSVDECAIPAEASNVTMPTTSAIEEEKERTEEGVDNQVTLGDSEGVDVKVTLLDVAGSLSETYETQREQEAELPDVKTALHEALGSSEGSFSEASLPTPVLLQISPTTTDIPSTQTRGSAPITPLEFLISRGLYKDRHGVDPSPSSSPSPPLLLLRHGR